jgi:hypothetical protein
MIDSAHINVDGVSHILALTHMVYHFTMQNDPIAITVLHSFILD